MFKNKLDEFATITWNKARLVVQGYNPEEGIDYEKTFTPIAKIEAIHILVAFAAHMEIKLYQMGVKSVFLNGYLMKEVYVSQPLVLKIMIFPTMCLNLTRLFMV